MNKESCTANTATAVNTAATDKVVAGRNCITFVLSDVPYGKYKERFCDKDPKSPAGESYIKATVKITGCQQGCDCRDFHRHRTCQGRFMLLFQSIVPLASGKKRQQCRG